MARKRSRQLELSLSTRTWGGARKGAGRKRVKSFVALPHRARPSHPRRHPLHVTLRLEAGLPSLRRKAQLKLVRGAVRAAASRSGFRVVHYSVQSNHLHLLVEASDKGALSRGMIALQTRIARGLNKLLHRAGRVFRDRYHARALSTPREVRNALAYVLLNARRHAAQHGRWFHASWLDPFSSSAWFDGWRSHEPELVDVDTHPPNTWLLKVGWRRCGLLDVDAVPSSP